MTRESDAIDRQHELNVRRLLDESPQTAEAYQEAARWLIAVRRGEIKCRFRKLLLKDGQPVVDPASPPAA